MENNKQTAVEWLIDELSKFEKGESEYFSTTIIKNKAIRMEKQQDKFTNSPIHDKKAIIEMMNKLHPKEMAEVVEFIKIKIETYGKQ